MSNKKLPTDDLKKYGIIDENDSFSKKLTADYIQKFLNGYIMVADHDKTRVTFQLTDNNSQLKVDLYERDRNISEMIEGSKKEIQYSDIFSRYHVNDEKTNAQLGWSKTAFIFDETQKIVREYDVIKNAKILTDHVLQTKNAHEINRYKKVLLQLKSFLQDKIEQYPEIAKAITEDLNIVINEMSSVDAISTEMQIEKNKDDIQLNVNDPDRYQDANRKREEDEDQQEDIERPRGLRR